MSTRLSVLVLLLVGCVSSRVTQEEAQLEQEYAQRDRDIGAVEIEAAKLVELGRTVVERYEAATKELAAAEHDFAQARQIDGEASERSRQAAKAFDAVRERWNQVTLTMLVIAATPQLEGVCGRQSTASYRRDLKRKGIDLEGKDIDHIIPRSLGGADNAWNYQVLDSHVNRSLGNRETLSKCLSVGPQCVLALAATASQALTCGR